MIEFAKVWLQLKMDRKGVTALEYALIGSAIAAVMVVGAKVLGGDISNEFSTLATSL